MSWLIACHDAGGAEYVSSWVRRHPENAFVFLLGGPAASVFKRKLGVATPLGSLAELSNAEWAGLNRLLCGTSWASPLERDAIAEARIRGVPSIAFLDHWVNYRERFGFPGEGWARRLPDEIWVGDAEAMEIARGLFPAAPADGSPGLRIEPNPYFLDIAEEYRALPEPETRFDVLYVAEPIAEHMEKTHGNPRFLGYDEFSALENAIRSISVAGSGTGEKPPRILLRPHPSEAAGKYRPRLEPLMPDGHWEISTGHTLLEDIKRSGTVVGCESMAMSVALAVGKTVYTSIPEGGRSCVLPQAAIKSLKEWLFSPC